MELLQLRYFQVVAHMEHITKASQVLNISQPSLSSSIHRLEKQLGVPLFFRNGRNIKLNHFGRTFLQRVEKAFRELEEGAREVTDMAGLDQGIITISVTLPYVLPTLLKEFLKLHPHVRVIQRQPGSSYDIKSELENGDIDFCISATPLSGPEIEWMKLIQEELYLTVPQGHRFASRESIDLIEAANEPFISLSHKSNLRQTTDEYCRLAGFEPMIAFELEEASAVHDLVEMGLGITFSTPFSLGKRWSNAQTVQIRISNPRCSRTFGIAWSKNHYLSQASLHFRNFVVQYFENINENASNNG
ncbi:LysR family transcriptional regulator [Paenibacillus illinoisensis]|uniref:LysR family transcriptional regulator n=1 Tax=Paenibacillus illinoisensis TaxID=59845 RepID=UPI000FD7618C|nr:LysR family transcriptional regulator [Paenibacillus illinoisensis]